MLLTLSEGVEFTHEGSQNEARFRQIINQMRPHATEGDQDVSYCQVNLKEKNDFFAYITNVTS